MPVIQDDYLVRNPFFRNPHFSTIYPTQFRKLNDRIALYRQRYETPDGDFIDCDLSQKNHQRVVFLFHGFEGSSTRPYMMGMAEHLLHHGWDVVAVNHRGCSGEPNRLPRAYHAGDTEDAGFVIKTILSERAYTKAALVGFSLGGNIVLNYLARYKPLPQSITAGVAISAPVDLRHAVYQLMKRKNWIYSNDFYKKLVRKIKMKQAMYPDLLPYQDILSSRNIDEFDQNYTAPFHGFRDAADYRMQSSSLFHLHKLRVPSLLVNALNDPFLTESCYPYDQAADSEFFHLLTPRFGGHCGFWQPGGVFYHEEKAALFIEEMKAS